MEPFHQLTVPCSVITDIDSELALIGFSVEKSLDPLFDDCRDGGQSRVYRRGDSFAAYSYSPPNATSGSHVLTYVNLLGDDIQNEIRKHLESRGAIWSYADF